MLGIPRRAATLALAALAALPLPAAALLHQAEDADPVGAAGLQDDADTPPASAERAVKADFLTKFLGYVDFPAGPLDPGTPYVVGVAGADDIAAELIRITSGRTVNNHTVVVRRIQGGDGAGGLHLLFVGADADEAALVKAAQLAGALSVTESSTGIEAGSVINFVLADERVRFEVSLAAADRARLKLSSRLLSVAYAVRKAGG
nr:YfiR family protein [uncultured Duganella sp.]